MIVICNRFRVVDPDRQTQSGRPGKPVDNVQAAVIFSGGVDVVLVVRAVNSRPAARGDPAVNLPVKKHPAHAPERCVDFVLDICCLQLHKAFGEQQPVVELCELDTELLFFILQRPDTGIGALDLLLNRCTRGDFRILRFDAVELHLRGFQLLFRECVDLAQLLAQLVELHGVGSGVGSRFPRRRRDDGGGQLVKVTVQRFKPIVAFCDLGGSLLRALFC